MHEKIRAALNRTTYEVGEHALQFRCEHAVFPVGGQSSICYCDSEERAEVAAEVFNSFKRVDELEKVLERCTELLDCVEQPEASGCNGIMVVDRHLGRILAENASLKNKLRAADAVMMQIDDFVQRQLLNSRSGIADARLNYGEPFTYEFTKESDDEEPEGPG